MSKDTINANLQAILAGKSGKAGKADDRVAAGVIKALENLGYGPDRLYAKLIKGEDLPPDTPTEGDEAELEAKIVKGVVAILKAIGEEVQDDTMGEGEGEGDEAVTGSSRPRVRAEDGATQDDPDADQDKDLDDISQLVASYLNRNGSLRAATKLTARLTAATNVGVVALAQRESALGRRR